MGAETGNALGQQWGRMTWGRSSECSEFFVWDATPRRGLVQIAETAENRGCGYGADDSHGRSGEDALCGARGALVAKGG